MDENEYDYLVDYLDKMRKAQDAYENSAAGIIKMFI